jgi:hypothetical protein
VLRNYKFLAMRWNVKRDGPRNAGRCHVKEPGGSNKRMDFILRSNTGFQDFNQE